MATTPAPLTADKMVRRETWKFKQFNLKQSQTAFKGGIAAIKQADAKAYAGPQATGYVMIGTFAEDVTNTAADQLVNVDLGREVNLIWFDNATAGDAVAATDFGKLCYIVDDHTVTITSSGASICGVVWGVDATKGVLVEVGRTAV